MHDPYAITKEDYLLLLRQREEIRDELEELKEQYVSLEEERDTLRSQLEEYKKARSEWVDKADSLLSDLRTNESNLFQENELLRAANEKLKKEAATHADIIDEYRTILEREIKNNRLLRELAKELQEEKQ